jgi:hypothetical protein
VFAKTCRGTLVADLQTLQNTVLGAARLLQSADLEFIRQQSTCNPRTLKSRRCFKSSALNLLPPLKDWASMTTVAQVGSLFGCMRSAAAMKVA